MQLKEKHYLAWILLKKQTDFILEFQFMFYEMI